MAQRHEVDRFQVVPDHDELAQVESEPGEGDEHVLPAAVRQRPAAVAAGVHADGRVRVDEGLDGELGRVLREFEEGA